VVEIMAGGGLAPESIGAVVGAGATSVHLSAKKAVLEVGNAGGGPAVPLGTADPGASHFVTDADTVRRARSVLDALATE
jgi:copper homeostasis protein